MPRPYVDPGARRKMGAMMESPSDQPAAAAPMDEPTGDEPAGESGSEDSKPTAFLPKEMGGGKQWKPGDEIVLKIDAVDPESGEMQVSYAPEKSDEPADEPTDSMSAMDKAMPK